MGKISNNAKYIYDMTNLLSSKNNGRPRGYEIGSIACIEYDLEKNIDNNVFVEDLKWMIQDLDIITDFIMNNLYYCVDENIIYFKNRSVLENNSEIDFHEIDKSDGYVKSVVQEMSLISEDTAISIGNRSVEFEGDKKNYRPKTDARLGKYILERKNRVCEVDDQHKCFVQLKIYDMLRFII